MADEADGAALCGGCWRRIAEDEERESRADRDSGGGRSGDGILEEWNETKREVSGRSVT